MNKHQIEGRLEQAKGKVKEVTGRAVGNDRLTSTGLAEQASGKMQAGYGDAKEKAKDNVKKTIDRF